MCPERVPRAFPLVRSGVASTLGIAMTDFKLRKDGDRWAVVIGDDELVVGHVFRSAAVASNLGRGFGGTPGSTVLSRRGAWRRSSGLSGEIDRGDVVPPGIADEPD
jgi:hypothetical protein